MLEIIGQILCAMLLFKGIEFIVLAFSTQLGNAITPVLALAAAAGCIMAALYFFNIIKDQASGARDAMQRMEQGIEQQREKFNQQFGQ